MGFGTYIFKVVLVIVGMLLILFAIALWFVHTSVWTLFLMAIVFVIGVAMVWYGKELRDC